MSKFRRQQDEPAVWPDTGRPNPWADLSGTEAGRYFGWPVVYRSARGDVWQLAAGRFVIRPGLNACHEYPTLALAVGKILEAVRDE